MKNSTSSSMEKELLFPARSLSSCVSPSLNADDPFLRLPDVASTTGLGKTTIYKKVREGTFPSPINLGDRATGWLLSEINQWKRERIIASRSAGNGGASDE